MALSIILPVLAQVVIAPQVVPDTISPPGPPIVLNRVTPVDWSCGAATRSGERLNLKGSLSAPVTVDQKLRREISVEGSAPMAHSGRGFVTWNAQYGPIGSLRFQIDAGATVYEFDMKDFEPGSKGIVLIHSAEKPPTGRRTDWRPYAVGECMVVAAKLTEASQ